MQQNIDFGTFPDDPNADAIRTAFQKVQENFNTLFDASSNQTVTSVNKSTGAGITVNSPYGNVVVSARIACVQIQTSTLGLGSGSGNTANVAIITDGTTPFIIDLPSTINNVANINLSNTLTANTVNVNLQINGNMGNFSGNLSAANLNSSGVLNITGNANVGNLGATTGVFAGNVTATFFLGDGSLLTNVATAGTVTTNAQPNITSVGTLTGLDVNGDITAANITANTGVFTGNGAGLSQITGANVTGTVSSATTADSATTAGTVTTNAQPNITSVGTLSSLDVTGNIISGNANLGNLATANFFQGDGSLLSNIFAATGNSITNGNSNVSIPTADGDVSISASGTANVLVITSTSANITGDANVSGNLIANNLSVSLITGVLTNAAQPNITSVGTLNGLTVSGLANLGSNSNIIVTGGTVNQFLTSNGSNGLNWITLANLVSAPGSNTYVTYNDAGNVAGAAGLTYDKTSNNVTVSGNIYANSGTVGASLLTGTLTTNAQPNITSLGSLSSLSVTGNINTSNLSVSNYANSKFVSVVSGSITSNIPAFHGNQIWNNASVVFKAINIDVTDTASDANSLLMDLQTNTVSQFSVDKSGNVAFAGVATGNGAGLSAIAGANVTGTVSAATTAGTVTTNAQPNITSVGTLSSLGVSGTVTASKFTSNVATGTAPFTVSSNTRVANLNVDLLDGSQPSALATANTIVLRNTDGNITGNFFIGNGSQLTGLSVTNGNSNVSIPSANGNVNLSAAGVANVLVVTGTGVNVTGNANVGNLNTAQVLATANVTAPIFISNIATGTAPLVVSSTTRVANLNTDLLDGFQASSSATANTVVVRNTDGNITGNFFIGNGSQLSGLPSGTGITNGNSNVSIPSANGNVNLSAAGVANVLVVTGTGINVTGNANIGNLGTAQVLATANITAPQLISNIATGTAPLVVSSTTQVANLNVATAGSVTTASQGNITSVGTLSSLAVTGTTTSGNIYANSGTIGASLLTGTLTTAAQPNITSVGTLSSLGVTGTVAASTFTSNVATGTAPFIVTSTTQVANLSVATAGSATTAGTVTTNAQPNITSVGTLSSLGVTATVTASTFTSNIATGTAPLTVSSTTKVVNLNADLVDGFQASSSATANTIVVRNTDGNITGNFFIGNGSQLTGLPLGTGISNGNSNVSIPSANGNVTISAVGVANVLVVTGTGANITGTLNSTGTLNAGNIYANSGTIGASLLTGTLTTAAQPNITSTGTLSSLGVSGTVTASAFTSNVATGTAPFIVTSTTQVANLSVATAGSATTAGSVTTNAQANITSVGTLSSLAVTGNTISGNVYANSGTIGASLLTGTLTTAAQPNITSVGTLSSLAVTANANANNFNATNSVVASTLTSNVAIGTAPLTVTSTTKVTNLNADLLDGYDTATAATANTIAVRDASGNITANFFTGNGSQLTGISGGGALISNGNSNVNIPSANGNVNISAAGVANILVVTGTGANIAGTANITGTLSLGAGSGGALTGANSITANYFIGTLTTAAQPNITSTGTLSSLGVTGTVTASTFTSNVATGTAPFIVTSTTQVANLKAATAGTADSATTAGSVTTNAQANITSVGTLSSLAVTANANANNFNATNSVVASTLTSNVAIGTAPLTVTSTTKVTNLNADLLDGYDTSTSATANTISVRDVNGNITANFFTGNGSQLTGISGGTSIANGNSNVSIPSANGNVNISAVGVANVLVVTGTGANIAGTANITGNLSLGIGTGGNITGANLVSANYFTGTLTTAAQPNITSVGTLSSLGVTGTVTASAFTSNVATGTAPFIVSSTTQVANLSVATAGSATTAGTVTTNAQANITSVGTLSSLAVTANANANNFNATNSVVASTLTSNVAIGTAPLTVSSTTRVPNLSVSYANVSDFGVVTAQTTGTYYPIFANGSSSGNYAYAANSSFSANLANGGLTATTFVGNLSGNISGNSTVSGKLTLAGNSSTLATLLTNASEPATITATAATGTINFYPTTQSVLYYTSNASNNWTVNFAASSGTTMDSALSTGQTLTVAFLVKQGATSYYANNHTVDGVTGVVTMLWQGGTAPTSGDNNSTDVYTYTLIKTASNAYTILASQTQFA